MSAQQTQFPTAGRLAKELPSAAKTNAIKTMQDAADIVAESLYKGLHALPSQMQSAVWSPILYNREATFFFVVAALPR